MNKAILMGRLTGDPVLRHTPAELAVCTFTLAIDRKGGRTNEKKADFIPIVVFGKVAEFCAKFFMKGRQVAIVGRIHPRSFPDNEGKTRYVTEVVAEEAYFADRKPTEGVSTANEGNIDEGDGDGFYPLEDGDELPF